MFSALSTYFPSCSSSSPLPTTLYSTRTTFHLLASLQLAVVAAASPPCSPCLSPPAHQDEKQHHHHHPLASHHHNPVAMRSQGKLALTFALRQHLSGSGKGEKQQLLGVVDALERAVDAAFVGQDYRRRIYHLGGLLAADDAMLWDGLRSGAVTVEQVGAGVAVFDS